MYIANKLNNREKSEGYDNLVFNGRFAGYVANGFQNGFGEGAAAFAVTVTNGHEGRIKYNGVNRLDGGTGEIRPFGRKLSDLVVSVDAGIGFGVSVAAEKNDLFVPGGHTVNIYGSTGHGGKNIAIEQEVEGHIHRIISPVEGYGLDFYTDI